MKNLQEIINTNFITNKSTIFNYTVSKNKNMFNGSYPLFYNNQEIAIIEWSNNPPLNSIALNNVIHGYLKPKELNTSKINIPNGLFIGTTWFKNNNVDAGLSVSNSLTSIFGIMFIISIEVNIINDKYDVNIILSNNNNALNKTKKNKTKKIKNKK